MAITYIACSASPQGMTFDDRKIAVNNAKPLMHVSIHEHIFGCYGLLYKDFRQLEIASNTCVEA